MKLLKARILNYKSHRDSEDIDFSENMNVVVGKNDAGKSAFIEALSLSFTAKPHRSQVTAPSASSLVVPRSEVEMLFELTGDDAQTYLSQHAQLGFYMNSNFHAQAPSIVNAALSIPFKLACTWVDGNPREANFFRVDMLGSGGKIEIKNLGYPTSFSLGNGSASGSIPDATVVLRDEVRKRIYGFKAERLGRSTYPANGSIILNPDASNLSEVLNSLSTGNPHRYTVLMRHLKTVFPEIEWVTTEIISQQANAKVWSIPIESQRRDLAIPLFDSGTGISQVLAILYVIVTSDDPQLICIDEPQSFLHPGAFRKLFEIIRAYPQHQYIVTTHSPSALLNSDRVFIAKREAQETKIIRVPAASQESSRDFLLEVGARLSDVFGADSVLWVEGKTEENCFPIILREVANRPLAGVQILSLIQTGDLNKKDASRILGIYASLSRGPTLMPQALAFILDDEGRSPQDKTDLNRQATGLISWLPRRLFENYLINASAISEVINSGDPAAEITEEIVSSWLATHARKKKFWKLPGLVPPYPSDEWVKGIHGAELLSDLFSTLTETRLSYDKVKHGVKLTEPLAARNTPDIQELATFLCTILTRGTAN
jgi:energy-coupling factor transporter ATP-binding protein EcfA2